MNNPHGRINSIGKRFDQPKYLNERPDSSPPEFGRKDSVLEVNPPSYTRTQTEYESDRERGQNLLLRGWPLLVAVIFVFAIGLGSGWLLREKVDTNAEIMSISIAVEATERHEVQKINVDQFDQGLGRFPREEGTATATATATGARGVRVHLPPAVTEMASAINAVKLPDLPLLPQMQHANVSTDVCNVRLSGVPKSGTTWLERIIGSIAENACKGDSSNAGGAALCKFESISPKTDHGRGFVAGPFSSASKCTHLDFSIHAKHTMADHLMSRVALAKPNKLPDFMSTGQVILDLCIDASPSLPAYSDACISKVEASFDTKIKVRRDVSSTKSFPQDFLIAILRDPRAVALSSCRFKFSKKALEDCPSATTDFRADTASLAMAWARAGASASHSHDKISVRTMQTLAVFFEDMKLNPLPAYESISGVLGLAGILGAEGLQTVADQSSVAAMAAAEQGHDKNAHWMERSYHVDSGMGAKVREGSVDGFLEAFGDEILGDMNRTMGELLPPELKKMYSL